MNSYRIPPYPVMDSDPIVKVASCVLNAEQVAEIRRIGDDLLDKWPLDGRVGFNEVSGVRPEKRKATVQWLHFPDKAPEHGWIYDAGADVLQQANALYWRLEITDFYDLLHYIRYDAGDAPEEHDGHFDWHMDKGDHWRRPQRKLAFSLLLSDPSEYEGGEFQVFDGEPITIKENRPGSFIVFPSFIQHRVLPVTKGTRRSLVGWASGPKFR